MSNKAQTRFEIFKSEKNGEWYWRLKSANHEIIATSEGYKNKQDCLHCIGLVIAVDENTPTVEV